MGRRAAVRVLGRALQAIGFVLAAGSLAALAGTGLSRASGYLAGAVAQVAPLLIPATPAPTSPPTPVPLEGPAPDPGPSSSPRPVGRGGPLEFSLNGSLSLGENSVSTDRTDLLGNPIGSAFEQTSSAVGLFAEMRRRTGTSTTDFRIPLGFSNTGTQLGLAVVSYSTPHYALQYGTQSTNILGQVPLGSTLHGPSLILPLAGGDLTIYEGAALGVDSETVRVMGLRARRLVGRDLFELAVARNAAGAQTGSATTLLAGIAGARGTTSYVGELAFQDRDAPYGRYRGIAGQVRFDGGGAQSGWTATYRHTPNRFLSYGAGDLFGDDLMDVGYRLLAGTKSFAGDVAYETTSLDGSVVRSRRSYASFGAPAGPGSFQLTVQESRTGGDQPSLWTGTGTLQLAMPLLRGYALLGAQTGRTVSDIASPTSQTAFTQQFQRQFGLYSVSFSGQEQRQSNPLFGVSQLHSGSFEIERQFGRTGLGYSYTRSHTLSPVADAVQRTPLFTVSRQISPVLSVQATFGSQYLEDRINPLNSGRSRSFNFTINAPFAFGNGIVQGRTDPSLPAIIAGRVLNDLGDNAAIAGLATGGVADIAVILDNTEVQRTDLDGNFQFSFVKPGQHQLRLEPSSLPRGLTADQPIVTLVLQGGQTGQVYFRVGDFGGIGGHVYGRNASGGQTPLSNVVLRVDGAQYSQTDSTGAYGFGRLRPGTHTVSVVENSVPAFATFAKGDLVQKIDVRDGVVTNADFVAEPLGSIAGYVLYDKALAKTLSGGVQNAYVVAEPGEHAAITDYDGSFIIDNLPPGTYSVSVDPETVPEDTGPEGDPLSIALAANERYEGARFLIGEAQKSVVFTFMTAGATAASVRLADPRLPPGGTTAVVYTAPPNVRDAAVSAFGKTFALAYDAKKSVWRGTVAVPFGTAGGAYEVSARSTGISAVATAPLRVDPKMPIVILQLDPPNVAPGQYAAVRARFLVDARAGDRIQWSDGQITTLGKPIAGRVFTFALRVSLRPLYGELLTHGARLPIRLL